MHAVSAASGKAALAVTIEPWVNGAVYETMFDNTRADWGKVTRFEQGHALAMTWHPGANADASTKVEVFFEDIQGGRAHVTLTHSGWEIWGGKADEIRNGYNEGWVIVFETRFAGAV